MIGKNLQKALGLAVEELKQRRHEYLTLEHVLYGIASEPAGRKLIERCGGSAAGQGSQLLLALRQDADGLAHGDGVPLLGQNVDIAVGHF